MAYIEQVSKVGQLVDAAYLNQFVTNMEYLAQPPIQSYNHSLTGGDYSTTAQQFLVAIDSTNMKFTIDFQGNVLIGVLVLPMSNTDTDGPAFGLSIDDDLLERNGEFGAVAPYINTTSSANASTMTLIMMRSDVSPGTHTVEPVWAANPDGNPVESVTAVDDYGIFFGVWER